MAGATLESKGRAILKARRATTEHLKPKEQGMSEYELIDRQTGERAVDTIEFADSVISRLDFVMGQFHKSHGQGSWPECSHIVCRDTRKLFEAYLAKRPKR